MLVVAELGGQCGCAVLHYLGWPDPLAGWEPGWKFRSRQVANQGSGSCYGAGYSIAGGHAAQVLLSPFAGALVDRWN